MEHRLSCLHRPPLLALMEDASKSDLTFASPFDDADADLIIRSSDSVYFRVYRVILAKASGVFKGMFTVPQPDPSMITADIGPPIVPLSEDGRTLYRLLQLCYPIADPDLTSLEDISHLQAVCDKYEMEGLMKNLERPLGNFIETNPLRVFAIACRAKFADKAREAAKRCLSHPLTYILESHVPEYKYLSIATYKVLPAFHHRCTQATSRVASSACNPWIIDTSFCFLQCKECPASETKIAVVGQSTPMLPRRWWRAYMDSVSQALRERADPSVISRVPRPPKPDCRFCNTRFSKDLERFIPLLEGEVQRVVDSVSL